MCGSGEFIIAVLQRNIVKRFTKNLDFAMVTGKIANTVLLPIVVMDGVCGSGNVLGFVRAVYHHDEDVPCKYRRCAVSSRAEDVFCVQFNVVLKTFHERILIL